MVGPIRSEGIFSGMYGTEHPHTYMLLSSNQIAPEQIGPAITPEAIFSYA